MNASGSMNNPSADSSEKRAYNLFLLLVAGLGGLLYGIDVGIIGGALPYLEATSHLTAGQLSIIVAAVLLGSVISTLFAGVLADWMGRKRLMIFSGITFVASIPVIALSHGYEPLFMGRLLQGISGGLIGVVVPLYLAECLTASNRGKGTGAFQWLLTLGIVAAAVVGIYYSYRVEAVTKAADAAALFAFKDQAWRRIFWVSLPPGALFVLGSLLVSESPRWLFRTGKKERAYAALLRSRSVAQADAELHEMEEDGCRSHDATGIGPQDSRFAPAQKVRDSIPASLRHSLLQYGHRHQFNHRLQRRDPSAEWPLRPLFPLGICRVHPRQFPYDGGRHGAGRSQGPQVPADSWYEWNHRFPDRCGRAISQHGGS